jgi:hypothetical protein
MLPLKHLSPRFFPGNCVGDDVCGAKLASLKRHKEPIGVIMSSSIGRIMYSRGLAAGRAGKVCAPDATKEQKEGWQALTVAGGNKVLILFRKSDSTKNRPPNAADGRWKNPLLFGVFVLFVLALSLAFVHIFTLVWVLVLGLLGFGVLNATLSMRVGCGLSVLQACGSGFRLATFLG